jgi:hypothetical protein
VKSIREPLLFVAYAFKVTASERARSRIYIY